MLLMGLRLGEDPRLVVTTIPRNILALKSLRAMGSVAGTRATTFDNAANLAPAFLDHMRRHYSGARLGRQERDAELIEAIEGALGLGALRVAVTKGAAGPGSPF
jgi:phage terminase large subunit-like protein